MRHPPLLLSEINLDEVKFPWPSREVLLLLGAILLVATLSVLWAKYFRKRRRHHSHHHHYQSSSGQSPASGTDMTSGQELHKRRRRRRRREHRPRNPTLAETGGLPPLRPDPPSEPLP